MPLGHRPGSDQPRSGRQDEGVCCKTPKHPVTPGNNTDDVSKVVHQKMFP